VRNLPFERPGRFFRGNLHTHSDRSDGALPPAAVVSAYRNAGYDFIALTDHFQEPYGFPVVDTRPFRAPDFTTLIGAELTGTRVGADGTPHGQQDIVAIGLPDDFSPPTLDETAAAQAARAAQAGAFVALAHPAASGLSLDEALAVEAAHAVEIFNGTVGRHPEAWEMADALLARGRRIVGFAADDAHFRHVPHKRPRPDFLTGWVLVRAESLDEDALIAALKAGHFYSSQGPELHGVALAESADGLGLRVLSSPVHAVTVSGPAIGMVTRAQAGTTFAFFPFEEPPAGYLRITVEDAAGRKAWTNPFWID
jgi:hypothetical protein